MKKIFQLLVLSSIIVMSSCNDDNIDTTPFQALERQKADEAKTLLEASAKEGGRTAYIPGQAWPSSQKITSM